MKRKVAYGSLIASCIYMSSSAAAPFMMSERDMRNVAPLMMSTDPGAERFKGVGKLLAATHCTATLISGEKTPASQSHALIITAGHCIKPDMSTNQVLVDKPAGKEWTFIPNYFIDTHLYSRPVAVSRILYSTMKKVDLAVMQLDITYGELARQGIIPLKLQGNVQAQPVELVHIPVEGVDENKQYLRHSLCHVTGHTPLLTENNYPWIWRSTFSVDCEGVAGGTSGAPVVERDRKKIIGILNTTTTAGLTGCGVARPCEVHENRLFIKEGASYFIPVDSIAQAITPDGKLDLSGLGSSREEIFQRDGSWVTQSQHHGQQATWNITLPDSVNLIRYKAGPASEINCDQEEGYGPAVSSAMQPLRGLVLPSKEGVYLLCMIHQVQNGNWTLPDYADRSLHVIDNTPPTLIPGINADENDRFWTVSPVSVPWEAGEPWVKYGPLSSTDCYEQSGYKYFLMPVRLSKRDSPLRFCTYGKDQAGNAGPVNAINLITSTINVEYNRVVAAWNYPLPKSEFLRRVGATSPEGSVVINVSDNQYFDFYRLPGRYPVPLRAGYSVMTVILDVLRDAIPAAGHCPARAHIAGHQPHTIACDMRQRDAEAGQSVRTKKNKLSGFQTRLIVH